MHSGDFDTYTMLECYLVFIKTFLNSFELRNKFAQHACCVSYNLEEQCFNNVLLKLEKVKDKIYSNFIELTTIYCTTPLWG